METQSFHVVTPKANAITTTATPKVAVMNRARSNISPTSNRQISVFAGHNLRVHAAAPFGRNQAIAHL